LGHLQSLEDLKLFRYYYTTEENHTGGDRFDPVAGRWVSDEMIISFLAGLPNATNVKNLSLSFGEINSHHSDSMVEAV